MSTPEKLGPIVVQTKGAVKRLPRQVSQASMPRIVPVRGSGAASGRDWIGFKSTGASRLVGISQIPLFAGLFGLVLLLLVLSGMWAREGR